MYIKSRNSTRTATAVKNELVSDYSMNIILWVLFCHYCFMGIVLWVLFCVIIVLWIRSRGK